MTYNMTRGGVTILATLVLGTPVLVRAQQRPPQRETPQLVQRVNDQFGALVVQRLELAPQIAQRLRSSMANWAARRDSLEREERTLRAEIASQLRPGVAADSVALWNSLTRIHQNRVEYAELLEGEIESLSGMLSVVQIGQLFQLREHLFSSARQIIQERRGQPGSQ